MRYGTNQKIAVNSFTRLFFFPSPEKNLLHFHKAESRSSPGQAQT